MQVQFFMILLSAAFASKWQYGFYTDCECTQPVDWISTGSERLAEYGGCISHALNGFEWSMKLVKHESAGVCEGKLLEYPGAGCSGTGSPKIGAEYADGACVSVDGSYRMVRCDVEENVNSVAQSTPQYNALPLSAYIGHNTQHSNIFMWEYGLYADSTCHQLIPWMGLDAIRQAHSDQCVNVNGSTLFSLHIKDCSKDAIVGNILEHHNGADCNTPGTSRQEVAKEGECHQLDGSWRMLKCFSSAPPSTAVASTAQRIISADVLVPMVLSSFAFVLIKL